LDNAFSERVNAVAGIAHPDNFFSVLRNAGLDIRTQAYADHHDFTISDLPAQGTLIMTEKDAVKCRTFARPDWWVLEWSADPDPTLIAWLAEAITQSSNNDISAIVGIHG
jgi:tetraacyldisaccharide 4'-kinase